MPVGKASQGRKYHCSPVSLCNGPVARWRGHLLIASGSVVLRKLSTEIRECYRLAQQARDWAEQATDPRIRQDYLSVERSWLLLALSYQILGKHDALHRE